MPEPRNHIADAVTDVANATGIGTIARGLGDAARALGAPDAPTAPLHAYDGQGPTAQVDVWLRGQDGQYSQHQRVPANEVGNLIHSGRAVLPQGVTARVLLEDGQTVKDVPSDALGGFLHAHMGRRLLYGNDLQQAIAARNEGRRADAASGQGILGTAVQYAATLGEAGANGITFGAFGAHQREELERENERRIQAAAQNGGIFSEATDRTGATPEARERANPITGLVGSVASDWMMLEAAGAGAANTLGRLAPRLLSAVPGEALVGAEAALHPSARLLAARDLATRLAATGMAPEAAFELASKSTQLGATALEGAMIGAHAEAEARIEAGQPLTAMGVMEEAGIGALLGVGTDLAFMGLGGAGKRVSRAFRDRVRAGERALDQVSGGRLEQTAEEVIREGLPAPLRAQGGMADSIKAAFSGVESGDMYASLRQGEHLMNASAKEAESSFHRASESMAEAMNIIDDAVGRGGVSSFTNDAVGDTHAQWSAILRTLDRAKVELRDAPVGKLGHDPAVARRIEELTNTVSRLNPAEMTPGELMIEGSDIADTLRALSHGRTGETAVRDAVLTEMLTRAEREMSLVLKDPELWGEAANKYSRYAAIAHPTIDVLNDFGPKVAAPSIAGEAGKFRPAAKKYQNYVADGFAPTGDQMRKDYERLTTALMESSRGLESLGLLTPEARAAVEGLVSSSVKTAGNSGQILEFKKFAKEIANDESRSRGVAGVTGMTPAFGGFAIASLAGGGPLAIAASVAGGIAVGALIKAGRAITSMQALRKIRRDFTSRFNSSAKEISLRLEGKGSAVHASATRGASFVATLKTEEDKQQAYEDITETLRQYAANPQLIQQRTETRGWNHPSLTNLMDQVQTHAGQATAYLLQNMPPTSYDPLTGKQRPISATERNKFLNRFEGASYPLAAWNALARGHVPAEIAEANRAVYPPVFAMNQQKLMEMLTNLNVSPPYQYRMEIASAFGIASDDSLNPNFLQIMQTRSAQTRQQARAVGLSRQPARLSRSIISNTMTETQQLEANPS